MSDQGQTFAAFVARELDVERQRRKTIDARSVAVVTVSGSLTTLLAAVGAFVSSQTDFTLPGVVILPLTVTLLAFAVAGMCAIVASVGRRYDLATPDTLRTMLAERWPTDEVDARNYVAKLDVTAVETIRNGNNNKMQWLITALAVQVAGLFALTVAVGLILWAAS